MRLTIITAIVIVTVIVIGKQVIRPRPTETGEVLGVKVTDFGELEREQDYWEKIVADSPTYRDGYIQLAVLNLQLQKLEKSKEYIKKALEVDPNLELPASLAAFLR